MKEKDSQFDVWLRIKPFEKLNLDSHSCSSQTRLRSTQSERNPFQLQRSRSKSPATFNTNYLSKLKVEKADLSKQDYRGFHAKEDTIHIDATCSSQASPSKSPNSKRPQTVRFPNIIHDHVKNKEIFDKIISQKVEACLQGKSFTMLTYGISGAGKSHTVFGSSSVHPEDGALLNAVKYLFERKEHLTGQTQILLEASFIEIYNEKAFDLFSIDLRSLAVLDSPFSDGVILPELEIKEVTDYSTFRDLIVKAQDRRIVCPNLNNLTSSRSHVIVELTLTVAEAGDLRKSRLRFVDLAGSEKVVSGQQVYVDEKDLTHEGSNINKSLLSLTNCINILSDEKKRAAGFVPYRNSKLTRILKDSLSRLTSPSWRPACPHDRLSLAKRSFSRRDHQLYQICREVQANQTHGNESADLLRHS